jgi:hypothetical protein
MEISGPQYGEYEARVERLDSGPLVIARHDTSYGFRLDSTKVFSDGSHLDFPAYVSVKNVDATGGRLCFDVEAGTAVFPACLNEGAPVFTGEKRARVIQGADIPLSGPADTPDPNALLIPQSTYDDFARLRPARVENGYTRESATIDERMGPSQLVGEQLWFGKQFYDGEGITGVGGFGYFDRVTKDFTLFHPGEVVDWSTSAILVEADTVWLGLVHFTEGAGGSGGLVQYNQATQQATRYPLDDFVLNLTRVSDSLYIGTSNGLYRFTAGQFSGFRFEPDADGTYIAIPYQR